MLGIGVIALDRAIGRTLEEEFDVVLLARASALAAMTELEPARGYIFEYSDGTFPDFDTGAHPSYFEIWVGRDIVLRRSTTLAGRDLARDPRPSLAPRFLDVALPDGRSGRQVQLGFSPAIEVEEGEMTAMSIPSGRPGDPAGLPATVVVATGRGALDQTLARLRWTLLSGGGAILLLLLVLGRRAVADGLAPIEEIGGQVERIGAAELGRRIEIRDPPVEIEPFVARLNDLIARLAAAFERERRLSADVAHELRTPVAELKSLAEVGARWPEDPEGARQFFDDAHQIALRMERTIESLLALARSEAGIEPLRLEPIDLSDLVTSCARGVESEARARGIEVRLELPGPTTVLSSARGLERIVSNLLENAVHYAPAGEGVRCAVERTTDGIELSVENRAPELAPEDLDRLFERFWRKDAARAGGRAGLGLALVADWAKRLGLSVDAVLAGEQRLRLALHFPAERLVPAA